MSMSVQAPHHPPRPPINSKHVFVATILGSVWAVVLTLVYSLGIFSGLEESVIDRLQQLPSPGRASADLALIDIQHIPSDRPWPWPRLDYALILRGLKPEHPQSIVFEMLLHDKDARYSAFDTIFADLVDRENAVLFSAAVLRPDDAAPPPTGIVALPAKGDYRMLSSFGSFFWPVEIYSSLGKVGIGNLSSEKGQNLRTVGLVFRYREQIIPSLSLYAAAIRLGADMHHTSVDLGHEIILRDAKDRVLRRIPINQEGLLRLRFRRPEISVPRINSDDLVLAADQADRGVTTQVDLTPLSRRQIWVGATDLNVVPSIDTVNGPMPPVQIQMQATHQILTQDYLHQVPLLVSFIVFLTTGVLVSRIFVAWGLRSGFLAVSICAWGILFISIISFQLANFCFPLATTGVHLVGVILCGIAARQWEIHHPSTLDPQMPLDLNL